MLHTFREMLSQAPSSIVVSYPTAPHFHAPGQNMYPGLVLRAASLLKEPYSTQQRQRSHSTWLSLSVGRGPGLPASASNSPIHRQPGLSLLLGAPGRTGGCTRCEGEGEGLAACWQGEGKLPLTRTCYSFQINHLFFFFFSLNYEQYGEIESNRIWSNSFPPSPLADALWGLLSQSAEAEEGRNEDTEGHQYRKHEAAVVRGIGVWCAWA